MKRNLDQLQQQLEAAYAQLTDQQKSMMIICEIIEKPSHEDTRSLLQVVDANGERFVYYMMQHYINKKYVIYWDLLNIPGRDILRVDVTSMYLCVQNILDVFRKIVTVLDIDFTLFVSLDELDHKMNFLSHICYIEKNRPISLDNISRN